MGKSKESKAVNRDLTNESNYLKTRRESYNPEIQAATDRGLTSYNQASDAYNNVLGGLPDLKSAAASFSGGVGPIDTSALSGDANAYRQFAQGDSESGRFYSNLMKTGGFTPDELTDIRTVGNRTLPSFFANLRNTMRTAQNATGGYSPGYSASAAAMARDAAHQTQDAALDTETGIADRVHAGKLQGAGGLERAFLGGMGGASALEQAIVQANLAKSGLDLQSKSIGAGLLGDADRLALAAAGGLADLRGSVPSEALAYEQLARGYGSDLAGNINQRAAYNPNQSFFDKYGMPLLNAGVGVLSGGLLGGGKSAASNYRPAGISDSYGQTNIGGHWS